MVLSEEILYAELTYAGQEVELTSTAVAMYNHRQKATVSLEKILEKDEIFNIGIAFVLLSAFLGLLGYMAGFTLFVLYTCSVKSFGVDTLPSVAAPSYQSFKDTIIRAPWKYMKIRPLFNQNKTRFKGIKDDENRN